MTTIPLRERKWIDIEPSKQDLESYDLSQESHQSSSTQSEVTSRRRWSNSILQNKIPSPRPSFSNTELRPMIDGKLVWLQAEDPNEDINIALIIWDQLFISVLLKDILEAISLILRYRTTLLIGLGIFPYIYHVGSNFNLHSIVRNGLVPGGQNLSRRQTVFFLPVDPRNENHKDPEYIDFSAPRLARYMHRAMEETSRCEYFGSILILESKKE